MVTITYITGGSYYYVRALVLFSLFLQTFLFLFAPLRRRMARAYIVAPIWLAFVYIDPVAYSAMAIISSTVGNTSSEPSSAIPELVGFWATFLLVHLGGADTITAFSLTDNELWLRHLLHLVSQSATTAYVFFFTLSSKNKLWLPTLLVFVAGFIKYTERIRSLYLASWRNFQDSWLTEPDPGPDYATLMDIYLSKKEAKLPSRIVMIPEPERVPKKTNEYEDEPTPLNDLEVVRYAYHFFQTFNGLVFCFDERAQSRTFFLNRTARDAFKVVELELNFFYEILYTKAKVLRGRYGFLLRFVSFVLTMAAFAHFYLIDKQGFNKIDVRITYILLLGAIILDITSFLKVGFSDRIVVALNQSNNPSLVVRILRKSLNVNRERWPDENSNSTQHCTTCSFGRFQQVMHRRWSESIYQCNLIRYCLKWAKKGKKFVGHKMGSMRFSTVEFTNDLRDFIFDELKMKSKLADDTETAKEIYQARGDWVLRVEGCTDLLPWINDTDFDESLLLWHIATELCFDTQNTREDISTNKDFRGLSKTLSDYMLYLLLVQYKMMSAVARIGQIRFQDTCAEAIIFFRERKIGQSKKEPLHKQACSSILDVDVKIKPAVVKGDRSKSVLFDACMLAKELEKLEEGKKWVIISKVWVELLSYAASRCTALAHAEQLCRGGQLITFVWLVMSHLGLENQFQISESHERARLIVGK